MTNEEAIRLLENIIDSKSIPSITTKNTTALYHIEALEMAIEALKNERPQGEWIPIKTRPLTEEEKEAIDCNKAYKEGFNAAMKIRNFEAGKELEAQIHETMEGLF